MDCPSCGGPCEKTIMLDDGLEFPIFVCRNPEKDTYYPGSGCGWWG
ncbi:MAG: hypothetical protein A4E49_00306 [Methanosaeta sp. PtaU1.Bin112]|nr:MAG: hypothetical protein A4E49_00306 [Methanosaeta sp. PtaU1.Bin112]